MIKKVIGAFALFLLIGAGISYAQLSEDVIKERKELAKASRKELNEKASKAARKEAKKYAKEGWTVVPGGLPLEKQLDRSYMMQMEYDQDMYPKYIMGEAMSIGENYDAAKMQAIELAKQNIAGQIQTEITTLIDNSVANKQLSADQAASIVKTLAAGKNLISQSMGRTITVIECYRTLPNRNKEVLVRLAYNGEMAKAAAKKVIQDGLEDELDGMHQTIDELLGW